MANISIRRHHDLDREHARAAVEEIAAQLGKELKAGYQWQGDCLAFRCPGAHGSIALNPGEVEIVVTLSWLLTPAKTGIERSIQSYLDKALSPER